MTVKDAAEYVGVSPPMISKMIKAARDQGEDIYHAGRAGNPQTAGRVDRAFVERARAERRRRIEQEAAQIGGVITWRD